MKIYVIATIIVLLSISSSFADVDTSECDKIKGMLKAGEKIDCLIALKLPSVKNKFKNIDQLKIIDDKIKSLESKKKEFDKKNKTLWEMYKNIKK